MKYIIFLLPLVFGCDYFKPKTPTSEHLQKAVQSDEIPKDLGVSISGPNEIPSNSCAEIKAVVNAPVKFQILISVTSHRGAKLQVYSTSECVISQSSSNAVLAANSLVTTFYLKTDMSGSLNFTATAINGLEIPFSSKPNITILTNEAAEIFARISSPYIYLDTPFSFEIIIKDKFGSTVFPKKSIPVVMTVFESPSGAVVFKPNNEKEIVPTDDRVVFKDIQISNIAGGYAFKFQYGDLEFITLTYEVNNKNGRPGKPILKGRNYKFLVDGVYLKGVQNNTYEFQLFNNSTNPIVRVNPDSNIISADKKKFIYKRKDMDTFVVSEIK